MYTVIETVIIACSRSQSLSHTGRDSDSADSLCTATTSSAESATLSAILLLYKLWAPKTSEQSQKRKLQVNPSKGKHRHWQHLNPCKGNLSNYLPCQVNPSKGRHRHWKCFSLDGFTFTSAFDFAYSYLCPSASLRITDRPTQKRGHIFVTLYPAYQHELHCWYCKF